MRQVYTDDQGIFSSVQSDTLLIDSSTIEAVIAKEMASLAKEHGATYIDAPVSGGVVM